MELTSKQRAQLRGLANTIDTIIHIGICHIAGSLLNLWHSIFHRHTNTSSLQHAKIVETIAKGNRLLRTDSCERLQLLDSRGLINMFRNEFKVSMFRG